MSLKQLLAYTENTGPNICEFEIECEPLCKIIKSFIKEYEDNFDAEFGRMLKVSERKVKGLAPIDECLGNKTNIIGCLEVALMELEIEEEHIEEIWDQEEKIIDGLTSVKWLAESRDLSALDLDGGIELFDDEIIRKINEAIGTSLDRESAMKDEAFKKEAIWYLDSELLNLVMISEYKQGSDTCVTIIKDA